MAIKYNESARHWAQSNEIVRTKAIRVGLKIIKIGDNLLGAGKAGQACIRDEPNAFGVPTKKAPSMREDAFFGMKKNLLLL